MNYTSVWARLTNVFRFTVADMIDNCQTTHWSHLVQPKHSHQECLGKSGLLTFLMPNTHFSHFPHWSLVTWPMPRTDGLFIDQTHKRGWGGRDGWNQTQLFTIRKRTTDGPNGLVLMDRCEVNGNDFLAVDRADGFQHATNLAWSDGQTTRV